MTPITGLERATVAVDMTTARPHMELPVKVTPKKAALSPTASLNRNTKYTGKMAATPDVANAEFAKSYIHHAWIVLRSRSGRSLILMDAWFPPRPGVYPGLSYSLSYLIRRFVVLFWRRVWRDFG